MDDDFKKFLDGLESGESTSDTDFLRRIMEPVYKGSDKKLAENRKHLLRQLKMDRSIFLMKMIREHGATPEYDISYKETIEISLKLSRLIEYLMKEELREGGA